MFIIFEKITNFWRIFWESIKNAYTQAYKPKIQTKVQEFRDILKRNYLAVFVNTLSNLANTEATFELLTDSSVAEPLQILVKDLQKNRYKITSHMLGEGGYFCFPEIGKNGQINHTFVSQKDVLVVENDGDAILDIYGVIDSVVLESGRKYKLLRHHHIDREKNELVIDYAIRDAEGKTASYPQWDDYLNMEIRYPLTEHNIGIAYYKSPIDDRGLSPFYGVPLNFACSEVERDIYEFEKSYKDEFKNAKSKVFADPRILLEDKDKKGYKIPENIYPISSKLGVDNSMQIYNPDIRQTAYAARKKELCIDYEKAVGTNRGFLTEFEYTANATKDEVRRANSDTIALLNKIHDAIHKGNEDTLRADALYLGIPNDYWSYKSDWYDPFENPTEQWQRMIEGKNNGVVEDEDLIAWLFPDLTEDERAQKLERIKTNSANNAQKSIEDMLSGRGM